MTAAEIMVACEALLARGTKPTCPEVSPIVKAYYALPDNGAGGSLHIVLDDGNIRDSDVEFCVGWAIDHRDLAGEKLARVILLMSKTQRRKV